MKLSDLFQGRDSAEIEHDQIIEIDGLGGSMHGMKVTYHMKVKNPEQDSFTVVTVAWGSVADFSTGAIVNAANEKCVTGFGIDGEINRRGGDALIKERRRLPTVGSGRSNVRCPTGTAVVTGIGDHTSELKCEMIIHAVGPELSKYYPDEMSGRRGKIAGLQLLEDTYASALKVAEEGR